MGGLFYRMQGVIMNLFVYVDESGVFDKNNKEHYVFGGIVFIDKASKDDAQRKFFAAENRLRSKAYYSNCDELKSCKLITKHKDGLYRSLNIGYRFATIIDMKRIFPCILAEKKTRQRYLDYALKLGIKACLKKLLNEKIISEDEVENIQVHIDQHTTATDGKYELKESMYQEFKIGLFNLSYTDLVHKPILRKLKGLEVTFFDSKKHPLIRASDVIANYVFRKSFIEDFKFENITIHRLP